MNSVNGVVPPMITPLLDEDRLDFQGTEKLINHLIHGGVHGLFILGTTGEGPSLKHSLRLDLIKFVCERVEGRIPVLVGIIDASFKEAVLISENSEKYGAQAVVMAAPFFYQIDQSELYNFTEQLIREISLPVYLYNNPGLTKVSFEPETVNRLLLQPEVFGIKDSSADMKYFRSLLELTRLSDRSLLMGPEELFMESLLIGADGGVPGGANIFPQLFVDIYESVKAGQVDKARKLHSNVMQLSKIVYSGGGYGSSNVINGIKCALKHMNICNDYIAKPLNNASRDKAEKIKQYLKNMGTYS